MRLWTFQGLDIYNDISALHNNIWCNYLRYARNIKDVDRDLDVNKYVLNAGVQPKLGVAPIYCFASIHGSSNGVLNVQAMFSLVNKLDGYYNLGLSSDRRFMIELEVPETEVILVRPVAKFDTSDDHYENKKRFVRSCSDDTEALLPYIKSSWIVAIRVFEYDEDAQVLEVRTHAVNHALFPLWYNTIWVAGDGNVRIKNADNSYQVNSYNDARRYRYSLGMVGCPRYYTLTEACYACESNTRQVLRETARERGISRVQYDDYLVGDIFPDGLTGDMIK